MYNKEKIFQTLDAIYAEADQIAPYVVIAQPRRNLEETPAQKFDGYEGLHVDLLGFSHGFVNIGGQKVDVARNYLIDQAIESNAKYLFFIGEDTVVPFDAFKILHETAEANPRSIVAGVYYIKASGAMIMTKHDNWITIPNVDPGQLFEAWQTGMDCMLIPIDLLRELKTTDPDLPFCCIYNSGDKPFIGEDNFFVHRIRQAGIKLLVNTDVQCLHMDLANGKYTAHPSVELHKYFTNIPVTEPFTLEDKLYLEKRWIDRIPGTTEKEPSVPDIIEKYKDQNKEIKFNMGCGSDYIQNYINVDLINKNVDLSCDITKLQLPENTVDEIYASHFLEHIHHLDAVNLLHNWYTSLKPEGKLILELPDLKEQCKRFSEADDNEKYLLSICIYGASAEHANPNSVSNGSASPHLWGYYPEIIKEILVRVGFVEIRIMDQQNNHPGPNFRVEAIKGKLNE
jgi:hypothetical protein